MTNTEHLAVKHLAIGYHYPVLSDIDFSIKGGQKVVITGFNGIGKSTLLKTLVGQIPSLQGLYKYSEQVTIGYFEQDLSWSDETRTPIQIVSDSYPNLVIKDVRKKISQMWYFEQARDAINRDIKRRRTGKSENVSIDINTMQFSDYGRTDKSFRRSCKRLLKNSLDGISGDRFTGFT